MSRSGFAVLVSAVAVVGFCAVWFVAGSAARVQRRTAPALGAPFMPTVGGKVECVAPDRIEKTCHAMAAYRLAADGQIEDASSQLLLRGPVIVMKAVAPVTFKADRVCVAVARRDFDTADFTIDGDPTSPAQTARFRAAVARAEGRLIGHEVCTSFVANGDSLLAFAALDGAPLPSLTQKVIFVSPADGYEVRP